MNACSPAPANEMEWNGKKWSGMKWSGITEWVNWLHSFLPTPLLLLVTCWRSQVKLILAAQPNKLKRAEWGMNEANKLITHSIHAFASFPFRSLFPLQLPSLFHCSAPLHNFNNFFSLPLLFSFRLSFIVPLHCGASFHSTISLFTPLEDKYCYNILKVIFYGVNEVKANKWMKRALRSEMNLCSATKWAPQAEWKAN